MTMQDEERRRIAREIHDGLGQELAAAKMILDGIWPKILLRRCGRSPWTPANWSIVRFNKFAPFLTCYILRCSTKWVGFGPPLVPRRIIRAKRDQCSSSGCRSARSRRLKSELETAIFRIVQEALTNMFRHSGARNGSVSLVEKEGRIVVTVRDDGKGIEEQVIQLRPESVGVGIGGMRQRVTELGGSLRLSNANPGTIVEVMIPAAQAGDSYGNSRLQRIRVFRRVRSLGRLRLFHFLLLGVDFNLLMLNVQAEAVVDAHVLVRDPHEREESDR